MKNDDSASGNETFSPIIRYRESITYDQNGEIVSDVFYRKHYENGSGFTLCYMNSCNNLVEKIPQASILRVFFHIAFNQSYDVTHGGGFKCSRKHLQESLNLTKQTIISALKWLEENFLVKEAVINGQSDFMVNPEFVTIGKSKNLRLKEWNRRCDEYIKKLELKNAKNFTGKVSVESKKVITGNFSVSSPHSNPTGK